MQRNAPFTIDPRAKDFIASQSYAEGVKIYKQESQVKPKSAEVLVHLAYFQWLMNYRAEARKSLSEAIEIVGSDKDELITSWGDFFAAQHQPDLAFTAYSAMLDPYIIDFDKPFDHLFKKRRGKATEKIELYKAAKAAIDWGRPDLARKYLKPDCLEELDIDNCIELLADHPPGLLVLEKHRRESKPLLSRTNRKGFTQTYLRHGQIPKESLVSLKNHYDRKIHHLKPLYREQLNTDLKYKKYLEFSSKINYLTILCDVKSPTRAEDFRKLLNDSNATVNFRMLAGAAMWQITDDNSQEFIAVYNKVYASFQPKLSNVEDNCVYLIATRIMHEITKDKKYQQTIKILLTDSPIASKVLHPLAIPFHLRAATIEIFLIHCPIRSLDKEIYDDLDHLKQQYLILLQDDAGLSKNLRVNLAAQALCPDTTIGGVMNVEQGIRSINFYNSKLSKCVEFLDRNVSNHLEREYLFLTRSTCVNLKAEMKFNVNIKGLKKSHNRLYKALQNAVTVLPPIAERSELKSAGKHPAMEFEMAGRHRRAELACGLEELDQEYCINLGNHFFNAGFYRLANYVYSAQHHNALFHTSKEIANLNLFRASYAAVRAGNLTDARVFINSITQPTLQEIYFAAVAQTYRITQEKAHSREPQGVHRSHWEPEVDQTAALKQLNKSKHECKDNLDSLFARALYHYEIGLNKEAIADFIAIIQHCGLLGEINNKASLTYKARAHLYLGLIDIAAKNYSEGIEQIKLGILTEPFEEVDSISPRIIYLYALVKAYTLKGDLAKAKEVEKDLCLYKITSHCLAAHIHLAKIDPAHRQVLLNKLHSVLLNDQRHNVDKQAVIASAYAVSGINFPVKKFLKDSNIAPQNLILHEITAEFRDDYLALLLNKDFWPTDKLIIPRDQIEKVRNAFLFFIEAGKLDLGLQALCSNSLIGQIFADDSASLNKIADALEACLDASPAPALLKTTRECLAQHFDQDPQYFDRYAKGHPKLMVFLPLPRKEPAKGATVFSANLDENPTSDFDKQNNFGL